MKKESLTDRILKMKLVAPSAFRSLVITPFDPTTDIDKCICNFLCVEFSRAGYDSARNIATKLCPNMEPRTPIGFFTSARAELLPYLLETKDEISVVDGGR